MKTQEQYEASERRLQERLARLEQENAQLRQQNESLQKAAKKALQQMNDSLEHVPLLVGKQRSGSLVVRSTRQHHYQPGELELALALAQQTVLASQLTDIAQQAKQVALVKLSEGIAKEQEKAARERVAELAKANQALKKTLDCLAAQPELDTFLGQVLIILVEQLAGNGGSFWFFDDDALDNEPLLHLDYDQGQIKTTSQTHHPGAESRRPCNEQERQLWQKLRHTKQLQIYVDIANDPALEYYRSYLLARGIESILVIPLALCDRLIGAFSIRNTQKRQYQPEELELAQALAQQVTLAIQLTRLAQQSREAAILEERNRMAQEIHDSLAQAFTGILMQLQAASRFLTANSEEQSQSCITRAQDLARSGLAQARHSLGYLSQSDMQDNDLDLFGTLTRIAEQLTAGTSVQAQVRVEGTPYHLNAEVGMNLLRIAQESLTNALRHSMAQTIQISLVYETDCIVVRVRDNGRGFNLPHRASNGFGLKGMQQRCDRIGAQLEIHTQPGAGTEIVVVMLIGNG